MQKYKATPGAEVIGSAMQNFFVTIGDQEIRPCVDAVFTQYQISTLQDDAWYPHQVSLDVFKQITTELPNAQEKLVALGMAYVETATFPPEVDSIYSGLLTLNQTYHLNIRNVPSEEGYHVSQMSAHHILVRDLNPFPHPTVYGFIWAITKRFRGTHSILPVIQQTLLQPDNPDEDGALYDIVIF